jgi:CHRD domain
MFVKTVSRKHLIAIFGSLLPLVFAAPAQPPDATNFVTHLNGAEEVPTRDCPGQGQAVFQLSKDGTELSYRLTASNINNVVAAHIHIAPLGVNGPVVLFLFGSPPVPPGGGAQNGVLGEGTATAADLVGPLTGMPMSALVTNMRTGNAYVNVHTNDGVAPTNTGCGDFPGGEIRGQIEVAGPQK